MSLVGAVFCGTTFVQSASFVLSMVEQVAIRTGKVFENAVCDALEYTLRSFELVTRKVIVFVAQSSISLTFRMSGDSAVAKSKELQAKLDALTKNVHCKEAAKYLAAYYTAYLKDTILHATDFDELDRPYWVSSLIEKRGTGYEYSKEGEIALYVAKNHEKTIQECLEVNILHMVFSSVKNIATMEKEKPETYLNFVLEIASKFALHFSSAQMFPANTKSQKFDHEAQARVVLSQVFPQGSESLYLMDLPFVQEPVYETIKNILPQVLFWSFQSLQSSYIKECCLVGAFQALRDFVNEKHSVMALPEKEVQPAIQYARQSELNEALYQLLISFMQCVDPKPLQELHQFTNPDDIKQALGKSVVQMLHGRPLFELINVMIEGMLPSWNKGGGWKEGSRGKEFKTAPFAFIHRRVDFERQAKEVKDAKRELHEQLEKIVREIGKSSDGLVQKATAALSLKKKIRARKKETEKSSQRHPFHKMEQLFLSGVALFETGVEQIELDIKRSFTSFVMQYLARKIHALGGQVYATLQQPVHNKMLAHLADEVIQLFQRDP